MRHASFEQPNGENGQFTLAETNGIQMELIEVYGGDPLDWINKYSEKFRELIEREPDLHVLYEKDPHACVEYIREHLEKPTYH